jgi:UDP-glucuronate 4-epimerase
MNEAVLVTGAAGFIGSHLVERFIHLGFRTVGIDNFDDYYSPATKRGNLRSAEQNHAFRLVEGDIRDAELLRRVFSENDFATVVHLAARAGVRPSLENPLEYEDINVRGTLNVLEACRTARVKRFIFASSSSVYGANGKAPFKEASAGYPISPYAATKSAAELFCFTYSHLYGLSTTVLRLFTVYGPRQRPEMAIHRFVKMIEEGEEVILFGNGTAKRDYTFVDDIVAGIEAAFKKNTGNFEVFNLGRGNAVDLRYIISLIEANMGRKARIRNLALQPGEVPLTLADISKARTALGYSPKVSVEVGIPIFVGWYMDNRR